MATLADIRRAADADVHTGTDDTTPTGTFYATTKVVGIFTTYLLAGDPADGTAPILGRIEDHGGRAVAYHGTGIKGGLPVHWSDMSSSASAFQAMRDRASRTLIVHSDTTALTYRGREVNLPAGEYEIVNVDKPADGMTHFVGPHRGYVWHIAVAHNPRVSVI